MTGESGEKAQKAKRKRAKGTGTLRLRGGTWQARWTVHGKVYVRSTGTGSRREAERRLAEFTADFRSRDEKHIVECLAARVRGLDAEIERMADERAALPLAAAFEAYRRLLNRPDTVPRTMEMYASQWWRLLEWLKENRQEVKTIQQVTRPVAEAFAEYVAQNFSAGTFNKYRAFMRCLWSALAETARLKQNPWDAIRRKRQTPHVRRALTADELRRVLAAAVTIPLHPSLHAVLDETAKGARRGPVMPQTAELYGRDTSTLAARTRRVFESCGIETRSRDGDGRAKVDVGFHSLRHTFVSMSANAGAPLAVVQGLVGHSSPQMTMHYYHGTTDAARNAVNALPSLLGAEGAAGAGTGADAPAGRVAALCAIAEGMTGAELAEAADRLAAMRREKSAAGA